MANKKELPLMHGIPSTPNTSRLDDGIPLPHMRGVIAGSVMAEDKPEPVQKPKYKKLK